MIDLAKNMPLIYAAVKRYSHLIRSDHPTRSRDDFVQLGAIVFLECREVYDEARHGAWGPFYFLRYHFAAARYAVENDKAVAVPFISYRRGVAETPRVGNLDDYELPSQRFAPVDANINDRPDDDLRGLIAEVAAELIDVANGVNRERNERLVPVLLTERWLISEPTERASIGSITKRFGLKTTIGNSLETRFREKLARRLNL